jgi:hypothetical protein
MRRVEDDMVEAAQQTHPTREVVGVFGDAEALEAAAHELLEGGFEPTRISMLAGEKTIVEKLGHKYRKVEELEDDPAAPRIAYRSTQSFDAERNLVFGGLALIGAVATAGAIFASGGGLVVTLGTGLIGAEAGGFIGGVLNDFIDDRHVKPLREQLAHGGLLLWVQTASPVEEKAAMDILARHSGRDVHAHALPAATAANSE